MGTIVPHTVEEAYEVAEAAGAGTGAKLLDELGDLLFQTFFLALLCEEDGAGDLAARGGGHHRQADPPPPARVRRARGRRRPARCARTGSRSSATRRAEAASSTTSPACCRRCSTRARCSGGRRRSASTGTRGTARGRDLADELRELREALDAAPAPQAEHEPDAEVVHELGDLLFAATNVARLANVDPELALRAAAGRFRDRVETAERLAAEAGEDWAGARPGGAGRLVPAGEGGAAGRVGACAP